MAKPRKRVHIDYENGRISFLRDPDLQGFKGLANCPYPIDNPRRQDWMDGWLDERLEVKYGGLNMNTIKRAVLAIFLGLACASASAQTYGLGDDTETIETSAALVAETFGLDDDVRPAVQVQVKRAATTQNRSELKAVTRSRSVERAYTSPAGYHRHVKRDGTIIEHADSNYGDPVAHAGIDRPWPKYFGPLPPSVTVSARQTQSSCPGGVCPTNTAARPTLFFPRFRR